MFIFLLVAGFFSGIATVFAATVPLGITAPQTQIALTKHDITAYVQNKSEVIKKPDVSFSQISLKPSFFLKKNTKSVRRTGFQN